METYLFYDLETTGLNHAFDQVVQFAAIRTDMLFNELERHELLVKLRPDVIPAPRAILTHGMTAEKTAGGICEYEAMLKIHALLNTPNTISLGYNTLRFDDEFLRFSFYRNLLTPYTHQYADNCRRMDLLPIVTLFWLYHKNILNWPQVNGRTTLKLEHLKEANQLAEGTSHDALIDVKASLELAKLLSRQMETWSYLVEYFQKTVDRNRCNQLPRFSEHLPERNKFGLLVHNEFGAEHNYQVPVLALGYSETYKNQSLWLRLDLPELVEVTGENIKEKTWVVRKKYGEPGFILPPKNRFLERLDQKRLEILEQNKHWLEQNPERLNEIAQYHARFRYPLVTNTDVDASLYKIDFYTSEEEELCRQFHTVSLEQKMKMARQFKRQELRELSIRLLLRNFSAQLNETFNTELQEYRYSINPVFEQEALLDYRGRKKLTPGVVLAQIKELRVKNSLNSNQISLLKTFEKYIKKSFPETRL